MFADRPDGTVDRTTARCGNFRGHSTTSWKTCGSFSPRCPQDRLDAALAGGHDCGHGGVLGVFAAAAALAAPPTLDSQHLPPLPNRGLARDTKAGVELETMRGRPLGLLRGLNLAHRLGLHGALLQDRPRRCSRSISTSGGYGAFSDGPTGAERMHVHRRRCPCSAVRLWPPNRVPRVGASADRGQAAGEGSGTGSRPICRRTGKRFLRSGLPSARFLSHSSSSTA
jgi:hypothetical protein